MLAFVRYSNSALKKILKGRRGSVNWGPIDQNFFLIGQGLGNIILGETPKMSRIYRATSRIVKKHQEKMGKVGKQQGKHIIHLEK